MSIIRESALNYYQHKPMEQYVTYFDSVQMAFECSGFHERPPFHKSGQDWFGVYWEYDGTSFVPDHRKKPLLEDVCDWRDVVKWPDLDSMDWEEAARIDEVHLKDRENFVFSLWLGNGPFERLHSLMGFEGALMALVEEEEECEAFFKKWTEWKCKLISYLCKYYKPDVIQFHDDSGTKNSSFYSKNTWNKLIKPSWTACCQEIKKHGVAAELHSCGKSQEFFKDILDCGFDSLFIQTINDWQAIREFTHGKVGFTPTDVYFNLESKAQGSGVTVKEVRDTYYNFVKKNIEESVNGYDFLMFAFPPAMVLGDVPEDTVLTTIAEVNACGWEWNAKMASEFNEMLKKKNEKYAASQS
nr:uroporphyrinogen decarboxylase family protein [uncultured Acetobacterium sp.]